MHHIKRGRLRKIKDLIWDVGNFFFNGSIFPDVFAVNEDLAFVRAVGTDDITDDSGLSGTVGTDQTLGTCICKWSRACVPWKDLETLLI